MPRPPRHGSPPYSIFFEDADIADFKDFIGPELASQFSDQQLPQLRRELWAWANFLLDVYESGAFAGFDSRSSGSYDEGDGPSRDRKSTEPTK